MLTSELDYDLPPGLIATEPALPRDSARLMVVDRRSSHVEHLHVSDLPGLLGRSHDDAQPPESGDLLVFNHSRVLPARFTARRVATDGRVGGLYLGHQTRGEDCCWQVMLESRGTLRCGERLRLDDETSIELIDKQGRGVWLARLDSPDDTPTLLARIGRPPLPPYILRERRQRGLPELSPQDSARYNTVYAADPGSVAAPTAGLHFTPELLDRIDSAGIERACVTLHVGLGTFAPVRADHLENHPIHGEGMSVPESTLQAIQAVQARGGRIIPVGTTTVRALESLPEPLPACGSFTTCTELFITPATAAPGPRATTAATPVAAVGFADRSPSPDTLTPCGLGDPGERNAHESDSGFRFRFTDGLMTNFHLPRSTLMAMVGALPGVGLDQLKDWYRQAISRGYRFYSYGDAMLIL